MCVSVTANFAVIITYSQHCYTGNPLAACQLEYFLTADRISFPVNVLYKAYFFQENKVMPITFLNGSCTMYILCTGCPKKTREFSDELDIIFVMN